MSKFAVPLMMIVTPLTVAVNCVALFFVMFTKLAKFAEVHGASFGRIELIAEIGGALRRLDLKDENVRKQVFEAPSSAHLKAIFSA